MRSFASILFSKPVMEPCFFLKMISEVHFDKLSHNPDEVCPSPEPSDRLGLSIGLHCLVLSYQDMRSHDY
jgi:hypothetical protein